MGQFQCLEGSDSRCVAPIGGLFAVAIGWVKGVAIPVDGESGVKTPHAHDKDNENDGNNGPPPKGDGGTVDEILPSIYRTTILGMT